MANSTRNLGKRSIWPTCLAALLFALGTSTVSAQAPTPRIDPGQSRSRMAVDATPPKRDRATEKMIATMMLYNKGVDLALTAVDAQPYVRLHVVIERGRPNDPPSAIISHLLVMIPDKEEVRSEIPDGMGICAVGGGVLGVGALATLWPGADNRVTVKVLRQNDPYLREVCDAFSSPDRRSAAHLARLPHQRVFGVSLPVDAFVIRRETPAWIWEDEVVRLYWAQAFSESRPRDALSLLLQEYGGGFLEVLYEAASTTGELSLSVPNVSLAGPPTLRSPFPDIPAGALKDGLGLMDARWMAFLSKLDIETLEGSPPRTSGDIGRFLRRFATSELGSKAFWDHLDDGDQLLRKANCLGVRFLIQEDYVRAEDLDNYRPCMAGSRSGPDLP